MSELETPKQAARRLMAYKIKEGFEPFGLLYLSRLRS